MGASVCRHVHVCALCVRAHAFIREHVCPWMCAHKHAYVHVCSRARVHSCVCAHMYKCARACVDVWERWWLSRKQGL